MIRIFALMALLCAVNADGLFEFGPGGVGVNFLGFRAGAGIGSDGKLKAAAGTPYGQAAGAGIEGSSSGEGRLYAGATAGGGVSAGAGLHGATYEGGSYGASYAGASNGVKSIEVVKEKIAPASSVSASYKAHVIAPVPVETVQYVKKPVVKEVTVVEQHPLPPPPQPTTVIQKTVIPNYEKKIIKVPSYEEKVVRVPTVIEKEVWVPAPPTIIEKEIPIPQPQPPLETVPVIYKTKFRKRPHFHFRKHITIGSGYGGGYAGGYASGGAADGTYSTTITKTANPQFYNDVFNIPISTLGAVNKLLTGISGGASGSIDVKKSFSVSGGAAATAAVH